VLPVSRLVRTVVLAGCLAAPASGWAHKASDSYLRLQVDREKLTAQWDIALRDLDFAVGLDEDQDGAITWGEVRSREEQISAYALSRLTIRGDGHDCRLRNPGGLLIDHHTDGAYAVLRLAGRCGNAPREIAVHYALLFDLDRQHRGLVRFSAGDVSGSAIFAPDRDRQQFALSVPGGWTAVGEYIAHGAAHIWRGLDHMLFLLSLVVPAVLVRGASGWRPATQVRAVALDIAQVVTAFTAGHAVTLTLSALGSIYVPARWAEAAIAASVLLAALNNVCPVVTANRWLLAGVFGLVHGLGFATVLQDLQLARPELLAALLGFNVGVELAQLTVVVAVLPVAWWWRARTAYRVGLVTGGSLAVALVALTWLAERAFNLRMLS
jgi:hypothetical protein